MTLTNSWICVILSLFLLLIEVFVYYLKPDFSYAINDEENYVVSYQKWIRVLSFLFSIIIAVISIYFAVNYMVKTAYAFVALEGVATYIYILVRYKKIVVSDNHIYVYRYLRNNLELKFTDITRVNYTPNMKIQVVMKGKKTFDASFNSDNFNTFYNDLIRHNCKFKTGSIPFDQSYIYISKFDITIDFPENMFREYYQSKTYFRNSHYLFSARNLEDNEYIEGYYRDTDRTIDEFVEIVKNDLIVNGYKPGTVKEDSFNDLVFTIIKSKKNDSNNEERLAYIYHGYDSFFVIYANYLSDSKVRLESKLKKAIRKSIYEDTKSINSRV